MSFTTPSQNAPRKRLREDQSPNDDGRPKTRRLESPLKRGSIDKQAEAEYGRETRENIDYWLNVGLGMSMAKEMNPNIDPALSIGSVASRPSSSWSPTRSSEAAARARIERIQKNADVLRARLRIALFKVQTNQTTRPISCLKLRPELPNNQISEAPPTPALKKSLSSVSLLQQGQSPIHEKDRELLEHMRMSTTTTVMPSPISSLIKEDSTLSNSSFASFATVKTEVDDFHSSEEAKHSAADLSPLRAR